MVTGGNWALSQAESVCQGTGVQPASAGVSKGGILEGYWLGLWSWHCI